MQRHLLSIVRRQRSHQDAARFLLHRQRHVPEVGLCPTLPFLHTRLLCQLFTIDEGEEPLHIAALLVRQALQRSRHLLQRPTDVFVEEVGLLLALQQDGRPQLGHDSRKALASHPYLLRHDTVA